MSFSTYAGVINAFDPEFARTGRVPAESHRFLIDAQNLRIVADCGGLNTVTADGTTVRIAHAEQFLELAENLIGTLPPP